MQCRGRNADLVDLSSLRHRDDGGTLEAGGKYRLRGRLKMSLKTPASWSAQPLRVLPEMSSGPGAL